MLDVNARNRMTSTTDTWSFSKDFVWGCATSAYQIEGAWNQDGKGLSIWDVFAHTSGKILDDENGDIACDHYHRYAEDVALMQELGLNAYRFSISWPRVLPSGTGAVNSAGLDFYDRLVDTLLAADIQPFATLYHWDLPQTLQEQGGWDHRDSANWFAEYAAVVAQRLGDRVRHWITHNEPWVVTVLGHLTGEHAPGRQDLPTALRVAHHLLLGHGRAVAALRASTQPGAQIGITLNLSPVHAVSDHDDDRAAAWQYDIFLNRAFLDPIFRAEYPPELAPLILGLGHGDPDDLQTIASPIDFLGVNYYQPSWVKHESSALLFAASSQPRPGADLTAMGWEIYAPGLLDLLNRLQHDYNPSAIYVTENGAAFDDRLTPDGQVHDRRRTLFIRDHLRSCYLALLENIPLRGYFYWSLMDNFEWAYGYSKRFGLFYVSYATQHRTWKDSARWFQQVIQHNQLVEISP